MTVYHWFLSFRDSDDNTNLGGCMVITEDDDPPDMGKAVELAWELGCNPGGEVLGFTAEGSEPHIAEAVRNTPSATLYTREQVTDLWAPYGVEAGRPKR